VTAVRKLLEGLDDVEVTLGHFQQDGEIYHTPRKPMAMMQTFCKDRVISSDIWPQRSPDLITPDFFLWGYVKERVFHNIKRTNVALEKNINN
jgi:hypothetical protein